ncbi:MAG TPA: CAP domain-containing protein [Polyangiaceae bacterium]|nr:CAP domain-containing protein [Polyangiaceae bacterium]
MKWKLRASLARCAARSFGPLMVALIAGACGSDDDSNTPTTLAGGTLSTGTPTTLVGGTGGTSATNATTSSAQSTGAPSTTATLSGSVTTSGMDASTTASTTTMGTTGFGVQTASSSAGGSGFGGQSAEATITTGGAGGTGGIDVTPGETGVFEGTVAAHNQARGEVDVMPPLSELVWSDELAEVAQDWANTLVDETNCGNIFHRPNGMYGENIALQGSFGGSASFTGPDAVASWVAEIDCYTYGTIGQTEQCDPSCIAELNSSGCGHYTQIVWDSTAAVGCGYGSCDDGNFTIEVIVCNYDPPGNYIGQTPY